MARPLVHRLLVGVFAAGSALGGALACNALLGINEPYARFVDAGVEVDGCAPGLTACGAAGCVDTTTNKDHCGGCGVPCRPPNGKHVTCNNVDGGGLCVPCSPGEVACGATCAKLKESPQHCGECGHACTGTSCEDFRCKGVEIASGFQNPNRIAASGDAVYWVEKGRDGVARDALGRLFKTDKEPCTGRQTCTQDLTVIPDGGVLNTRDPAGLAINGASVFVGTRLGIFRASADLTGPVTAPYAALGARGVNFYADGVRLCWAAESSSVLFLCGDENGSTPKEVISGNSSTSGAFLVVDGFLYGVVETNSSFRVVRGALDGTCVAARDGCKVILDDGLRAITSLAYADGWLYWRSVVATGLHGIFRKRLDSPCTTGTDCFEVVAEGIPTETVTSARRLLTDGRYVYWHTDRSLNRQRIGGVCRGDECNQPVTLPTSNATNPGSQRLMLSGFELIFDIAQDDQFLYVAGRSPQTPSDKAGVVVRVPK